MHKFRHVHIRIYTELLVISDVKLAEFSATSGHKQVFKGANEGGAGVSMGETSGGVTLFKRSASGNHQHNVPQ